MKTGIKWKKNDEIVVDIDDLGNQGEGVAHIEGYALFIKGALPGEKVLTRLMKLNKSYGFGRLIEILIPSADRREPLCPVAKACGGCELQHLTYEQQLAFKEKKVRDCLTRIGGADLSRVEWYPILGMTGKNETSWHYRNKAQFPVRQDEDGNPVMGFFASRTHRLIPVQDCAIQHPQINETANEILDFMRYYQIAAYVEESQEGLVRHIYVRRGFHTGQIMVCIVVNGRQIPHKEKLVEKLCHIEGVTSIYLNVNKKNTNVILGDKMILLYGKPYIEDKIGNLTYRISPQSFYQVNPVQTEKLYQTALDFAALQGDEHVWDLYCGIGTLSLFLAQKAEHVTGVEIIPAAVENAKENAGLNNIKNTEFYCGAAEEITEALCHPICTEDSTTFQPFEGKTGQRADVVVVDPPRKGCDRALLDTIAKMQPDRIVYVSCDPATLARDVKILGEKGYQLRKVRACDMFPQGGHVECVTLLQRKNT